MKQQRKPEPGVHLGRACSPQTADRSGKSQNYPSISSSINVGRPLPLPVRLSSRNKQTRSSCQACPPPPPLPRPLAPANRDLSTMAFQICNLLTYRLQSREGGGGDNGSADRPGIVSETNAARLLSLRPLRPAPLFDIIFQISAFAPLSLICLN